jgi:alkanesulfonate monooxygenase SsuD/methylene tetrahydromethanopterin reductase-like flavin-dependent oxidoreductase (luciferase family)
VGGVRIGLALPQYDYSLADEAPLRWDSVVAYARTAADAGFDSLWLSDHLFLDLGKYGGSPERSGAFEPLVTLAALARTVPDLRLGTLVLCEALRPASVLAKALVTLDRISGGRLDVGVGAGWYEPEYAAVGMDMPPPATRLARLADALDVLRALFDPRAGEEPVTAGGAYHRVEQARSLPPAVQRPRPPVFVGGKGDRLLRLAAERADGWNTCWSWTPAAYRERVDVLEQACERVDRDPSTIWRSLGLYALCGDDDADLARRFDRLRAQQPGVMAGVDLDAWRAGRLVGTPAEVGDQAATWAGLGVETLVLGVGCVPFAVTSHEDVAALGAALAPIRHEAPTTPV